MALIFGTLVTKEALPESFYEEVISNCTQETSHETNVTRRYHLFPLPLYTIKYQSRDYHFIRPKGRATEIWIVFKYTTGIIRLADVLDLLPDITDKLSIIGLKQESLQFCTLT